MTGPRRCLPSLVLAVCVLAIVLAHPVRAEDPPEFTWIREFGSPAYDSIMGMSSDGTGIYVAGRADQALPGQNHHGRTDGFVRKYDFGGGEQWTYQIGTGVDDSVSDVVAGGGAVYVTGSTAGSLPGQTSAGGSDVFLRKYSPEGAEVWTIQFGTNQPEWPYAVALHSTGLYVTGVTHGAFPGHSNAGGQDSFLQKYDFDGNHVWTRQFGTGANDGMTAVLVDDSGIYVAGWTTGALPGQTSAGDYDTYVRKYDLAGVEQWTDQFGSAFSDHPDGGVVADSTGIYVSGYAARALTGQTSLGGLDAYLRKYDRASAVLWTLQFGTSTHDGVWGSYADDSGVWVTGTTWGAFPGYSNAGVYGDVFLRKYDALGTEAWTRQFGSSDHDGGAGVVVAAGSIFLSGWAYGAMPTQSAAGDADVFVIRLGGTPGADVSPASSPFGDVEVGTTVFANVTIMSVGTAFLSVTSISLVTGTQGFALRDPPPTPFYLPQLETVDVTISFAPSLPGFAIDTLRIATNDPSRGSIEIPLSGTGLVVPRIEVEPEALAFGPVEAGTAGTRDLMIRSRGSGSLTITSLTLSVGSQGYAIDASPTTPFDVPPGGTAWVRVRFSPTAVGPRSDTLRIASNDAVRPIVDVSLGGEGFVVSDLDVDPASLGFGAVELGTRSSRTVSISSVGSGDVTVTGISLASGTGGFEIVSAPATPFVLRARLSSEFQVAFAPSAIGASSDVLTIFSDVPDEGSLHIPLDGEGVDTTPPHLAHVPPGAVTRGQAIPVRVIVTDLGGIESVTLYYRRPGETDFHLVTMESAGDAYQGEIPAQTSVVDISYHIVARDRTGNEAREPAEAFHTVRVTAESVGGAGDAWPGLAVLVSIVLIVAITLSVGLLVWRRRRSKKPLS